MNNNLFVVVVLYNKKIDEIVSLDRFLQLNANSNVVVVIADNSDKDEIKQQNSVIANDKLSGRLVYIDNGGNVGLTKSYNKVIPMLTEGDYLMLSDDDTLFSNEYLENVVACVAKNAGDVFCGIVKTGNGFMSPLRRFAVRVKPKDFITEVGEYTDIYAINSGLVLSKHILNEIKKFPEQLFLDMVDYWLMDKLILLGLNKVIVLPGDISQSFSGEEGYSKGLVRRYKIYKKDVRAYSRLIPKRKCRCAAILLIRKTGLFFKKWKTK